MLRKGGPHCASWWFSIPASVWYMLGEIWVHRKLSTARLVALVIIRWPGVSGINSGSLFLLLLFEGEFGELHVGLDSRELESIPNSGGVDGSNI